MKQIAIHDVQFHPTENMIAFAGYGFDVPVFVYGYCEENRGIAEEQQTTLKRSPTSGKVDFNTILCKIDQIMHKDNTKI